MLSPLPRRSVWAYCFAHFTQPYQPSPKGTSGRPAHCPFRGLLGVHSRSGRPPRAFTNSCPANQRLQPLRCLHDCSGCFRLERLPGGSRTHWKTPPFHGAHPQPTSTCPVMTWVVVAAGLPMATALALRPSSLMKARTTLWVEAPLVEKAMVLPSVSFIVLI